MPHITTNKRALHDYHVLKKIETGIVLTGAEVKSAKGGLVNLKGSYVTVRNNELWLLNMHISPYPMASTQRHHEPLRDRKLLLKRAETASLIGTLSTQGLTVLPLSVYTKGGLIKVEVGVCRGKKLYDKRQILKKRESDRALRRVMRQKE
ncbi:MAG: SsrA-binding protein SmpB [Patescibacteria group bacterium]|nr:SsrA-binding protein SmpB [Patescibacteria group bacterium]MDD5715682.1 SsrA-binding protein SmpB [Patescibacteria group bacterium]